MSSRQARAGKSLRARGDETSAIDDPTGMMGIRLVSQRAKQRLKLGVGGARVVVPLDVSAISVEVRAAQYIADRASWIVLPARASAVIEAKSLAAHTLVLEVSEPLARKAAATYAEHIHVDTFNGFLSRPWRLQRTTWFNEICHRYVFERAACMHRDNEATHFLETEIAKEIYFACRDEAAGVPCTPVGQLESDLVREARSHIERHLFDDDVLTGLPRACGASASTILRAFQRELGAAPLAYVRARRLDEALHLVKSSRSAIGEIATLVGYRSLPAFSEAFQARFGRRPSEARAEAARPATRPAKT